VENHIRALLLQVSQAKGKMRRRILQDIRQLDNAALPYLLAMLDDPEETTRATTVETLSQWEQNVEIINKLIQQISDPSRKVQAALSSSFLHYLDPRTVPAVLELLAKDTEYKQANPEVERDDVDFAFLEQIFLQMGRNATSGLIAGLQDSRPHIRRESARAIGWTYTAHLTEVPNELIDLLQDENEEVKSSAARSIEQISQYISRQKNHKR
jgi:HEAT repeat protein